jgi:hypothetical protein
MKLCFDQRGLDLLRTKVHNSHVIEQRSAPLGRLRVVGPEEDGHGGTGGGDRFLSVHPSIFGCFVPGEPLYAGCLMVPSTAEVNPQSEFDWRGALDMFTPGRDSVAMARGNGNSAVDARRGSSEIEGQLLGTLSTMDVGRVLILVEARGSGVARGDEGIPPCGHRPSSTVLTQRRRPRHETFLHVPTPPFQGRRGWCRGRRICGRLWRDRDGWG